MWELDNKEGRVLKNWCFRTVILEKTLESFLGSKEIKLVNQGNQPSILFGRTDAEAPILWPPNVNSWLIGKDPRAGKHWRQKEKRVAGDEMVRWYYWLNGHELGQTLGDGEGQRSLACCSPRGREVGHDLATEQQQHCLRKSLDSWGHFFFFFATLFSMWDLSFPAKDWTHNPALEAWSLNHWTTGKSQAWGLLIHFSAFPGHIAL